MIATLPKHYDVELVEDDIYKITPSKVSNSPIAVVALIHGEEILGLHIFIELLLKLHEGSYSLDRELYLVIANRAAYLKDQRYVDADLNRAYGSEGNILHEEKRANIIKPIIQKCDYIIDLHQTVENTLTPFFMLPYTDSKNIYYWVSRVAPNIPVMAHSSSERITTLSSYGASLKKNGSHTRGWR